MSFAIWKAFLYKTFSVYKNKFLITSFEIFWPLLILLLSIKLQNMQTTNNNPSPNSTYYSHQGEEMALRLSNVDLYADQRNSFMDHEDKRIYISGHDFISSEGNSTKHKLPDHKISVQQKYYSEKNKHKRSTDPQDRPNAERKEYRQVCTIKYGLFILVCFLQTWSSAGVLAHVERMSGTVERIRMQGVDDWSIICSYVIHAGIIQFIVAVLYSWLLKSQLFGTPFIQNIDFFSLSVAIFLLSLQSSVYMLGVAYFFSSAVLNGIIGNGSYLILFFWASKQHFSITAQVFSYMLAPLSLFSLSSTACGLEESDGVTLKSLISATDNNDIPLLIIPLAMSFGSLIVIIIVFYMLNISPGPYGNARSIYFMLPQRFQNCLRPKYYRTDKSKLDEKFRTGLYEETSANMDVGIKIENLYKKYGNFTSLKNFSLNIYSGQITALLGHNGAGKSTTLSILSGMLSPTSGSAFFEGYDILTNLKKFRKDLGLCPQENLLHPNLNVVNQLVFYGMLGGLSRNEAVESANNLLTFLGILEKKNVKVSKLSGGMQRKLCIALAFVGKPRVVILDEPTSGVDPESRREIWDMLLESRGNRIMLLTTHFMEEADALGDQIAIMSHGEIICYGSPMFLKKHYGAGYDIKISSDEEKRKQIIETVTGKIPEATIICEHEEWVQFKLPYDKTEYFPELFNQLESNDMSQIGINCTTMEDVYLKAVEGEGSEVPSISESSLPQVEYTSNIGKIIAYIYRFLGLIRKNMICVSAMWFKTLLVVAVVPPAATYFAIDYLYTDYNMYYEENIKKQNLTRKGFYLAESAEEQQFNDFIKSISSCHSDPIIVLRAYFFSGWFIFVIFAISSTFSNLVHKERLSTVKHLILMTGVSPVTYWSSILFSDAILYLIFILISWTTVIILDSSYVFDRESGIYFLFLVLFLSGMSMISSVYFITLLFKTMQTVVTTYLSGVFTLGIAGFVVILIESSYPYSEIFKLLPVTTALLAMLHFSTLALKKHNCKECVSKECEVILQSAYIKDDELRSDILFLVLDLLLYLLILTLTDYGFFPFLWDKIKSIFIGRIENSGLNTVDVDVAKEQSRVQGLQTPDERKDKIAIVDGLAKKYSRSMVAVFDVTFALSKGECFGLLGVNGAGKSTTFNMLTGNLYPTKGNVFVMGYALREKKGKCLSMIGYCPQHTALIDSLTARQMLTLFAKLRLVPSQHVVKEVKKWISVFGLDEYCDIPCKHYSGGNKRKLNAALAFIGSPTLILLDEPTTGVDPFIRRNFRSVIEACGTNNQAIIISSHSMDECEAVCNKLTIMAKGKMECIGNPQHLKATYGTGFVIKITLAPHTDTEIGILKGMIEEVFYPHYELKDEHKVLLHYLIKTRTYKISKLFEIMERIKKQCNIVGDYIITDSSLEDVFLGFAGKEKRNIEKI